MIKQLLFRVSKSITSCKKHKKVLKLVKGYYGRCNYVLEW